MAAIKRMTSSSNKSMSVPPLPPLVVHFRFHYAVVYDFQILNKRFIILAAALGIGRSQYRRWMDSGGNSGDRQRMVEESTAFFQNTMLFSDHGVGRRRAQTD